MALTQVPVFEQIALFYTKQVHVFGQIALFGANRLCFKNY